MTMNPIIRNGIGRSREMNNIWEAALLGTVAGCLGTGLGGLIISVLRTPKSRTISFILAFSGGIMLAVIFNDLIPESMAYGNLSTMLIGFLVGCVALYFLDHAVPHVHVSAVGNHDKKTMRLIRTSILIGIGIAVHNFPEGLAIGAGYAASQTLGIGLAVILALHDAPEGMAMAGPMKAANLSPFRIVATCTLAGVPTGLGALLGAYLGGVSDLFLSVALGFAAGAMIYLVFDELLPISQELNSEHSATFGGIVGVAVGILFMTLLE